MARRADPDRFDAVYRGYGPSVLRYCAFSTGSREDGEDIAAEVFSRFLAKGGDLADVRVPGWLFLVARNLCRSHHRSAKRGRLFAWRIARPESEDHAWRDPGVWTTVGRLDEAARLVVFLRAVEDRPFSDIARITNKKEGAVKMTYYRALERLRVELEAEGYGQATTVAPVAVEREAGDA